MGILRSNLFGPVPLSFALGILARLLKSEFALPKDVYAGLSIYLLFALGLHGGVEMHHAPFASILAPAGATLLLGCITPVSSYGVLRKLGRFSVPDAAGIAAHYGSVSAVTFIAASTFAKTQAMNGRGAEAEGFMPTLLTLLESPGIHIALAIGALKSTTRSRPIREVLHEVLTARTMVLLVGGLVVGYLLGDANWKAIEPFYDTKGATFRGALCIFMLEMGMLAGSRFGDLKNVGPFLFAFAVFMPVFHGALGVAMGSFAGLSVGGATVLGAMAASASYIAAPPAVRVTLPEANPTLYLTSALAITFPFNILVGIPIYFENRDETRAREVEEPMHSSKLTLVTIVAEEVLESRILAMAKSEGATGFTSTPCRGEGTRGLRTGAEEGGNVRIEIVVREEIAERIVERLSVDWFPSYAVIAWLTEVRVARGEKYV